VYSSVFPIFSLSCGGVKPIHMMLLLLVSCSELQCVEIVSEKSTVLHCHLLSDEDVACVNMNEDTFATLE
jgi:hypothetical protein